VALGILVVVVGFGLFTGRLPLASGVSADSQHLVSLYADGQKRLFATNATTVGEVLSRAGVTLQSGDLVEPSANTTIPSGQFNINVYRARRVLVVDGSHSYLVNSAYQSPHLLAQAAGLTVYPEDTYQTQVITNFVQADAVGEEVLVHRATPFNVQVDGKTYNLRTQAKTVKTALASAGIALGPKDVVSAPLTAPVTAGATIGITRVTEALATITQTIPHSVQTVTDPDMMQGQTAIKTPGADGQTTATYMIHYTNGVETSRQLMQLVSQTAPVPQVVEVGTKVIFEGSVEYWRPQVEAAAAQYGLDPNVMMRIMECESNGNAADVSKTPVYTAAGPQYATGLFQFLPSTWAADGGASGDIMDGAAQIQIAAKVMAGPEGTSPWACQ
jgi:resuscitation-promoting factor RpfB